MSRRFFRFTRIRRRDRYAIYDFRPYDKSQLLHK